jgi:hypothetical protein
MATVKAKSTRNGCSGNRAKSVARLPYQLGVNHGLANVAATECLVHAVNHFAHGMFPPTGKHGIHASMVFLTYERLQFGVGHLVIKPNITNG